MTIVDVGLVIALSALTAFVVLLLLGMRPFSATSGQDSALEPMTLLFNDGFLHHGTQNALNHLCFAPDFHGWSDFRDRLLPRFPDLPDTPGAGRQGAMCLIAADQKFPNRLELNWEGPLCWVTLDGENSHGSHPHAAISSAELEALQLHARKNPNPAWLTNQDGQVIWENHAHYLLHGDRSPPNTPLFPTTAEGHVMRAKLRTATQQVDAQFEITTSSHDGKLINHATNIDPLVAAERARQNFVQTLSKTFAHLTIGLAIFDRNGQLALFNPALVDMTGLGAAFLSRQPTLLSFFDQLRENRLMPEPKNYRNWREEITSLVAAAADGRYKETWSLEDGRTFAVQGRPHPDGATAFLIEDISAEITLTRNFRKESELTQTLLDHVSDAMIVFSNSGLLTFCNAPYRALWQHHPESTFADVTIHDAVSHWQTQCERISLRQEIEDFVLSRESRDAFSVTLRLLNGQPLRCDLQSVGAGARLLRFPKKATLASGSKNALAMPMD